MKNIVVLILKINSILNYLKSPAYYWSELSCASGKYYSY